MRILFVHGTGVRREGFDALFELVRSRLGERLPDAKVEPCYWGGDYGAALAAGGVSIPGRRKTRGPGEMAAPSDEEAAEWALLLADPLCELRVLAEVGGGADGYEMPGVRSEGDRVADRLAGLGRDLPEGDEMAALLRSTLLAEHYRDALERVGDSAEFAAACARVEDAVAAQEVASAAARALVAGLLKAAGADALCTGDERDRLVGLLVDRLGGTTRAPGGKVALVLGKLALRVATQPALDHWRVPLTRGVVPALGDILRYQARGGPLREFLERQITAGGGPAVVIGHSLGGIALVDLLAMRAPVDELRLLVTAGSQAPFLHELGALSGLAPGASLPAGFPDWLNIFDRQDVLAFRAAPVFQQDSRVRDFEVSSRQPFPVSHSAYWKLDTVYDQVVAAVNTIDG
ncbi:hypothetical protein ACWDA3_60785 [Nonomuraea rubra]